MLHHLTLSRDKSSWSAMQSRCGGWSRPWHKSEQDVKGKIKIKAKVKQDP